MIFVYVSVTAVICWL